MGRKKIFQIFIIVLLLVWYGLFFVHKIDLTTADLGRHLKNGQMILKGQFDVLKTNFYSYTQPEFPVVNHHWGAGVIFFLIFKLAGFKGLSLFYLILSLTVFFLFFRIAQKEADFKIVLLVSLLLIPLMASRTEVRPEIFSYLFAALFFWILWYWRKGQINPKWLLALPVLQLIWVNTHIYFILGPCLVGLFLLERIIRKLRDRALSLKRAVLILILTGLASLATPFTLKGLIYPFLIFKNYGYRIVENQSIWFLENLGIVQNPNLSLFKVAFWILVLSFVSLLIGNRRRFSLIYFILSLVFSLMGWLAIRNFALFGFFALPIIAANLSFLKKFIDKNWETKFAVGFLALAIFLITFFTHQLRLPFVYDRFGFGLFQDNNQSAQFFRDNKLKGPIFNNYDIGGYLIYHFFPKERVFVDNRPEAYSVSFFKERYIPMQQDESGWQRENQLNNFNVIFFSHHDATPWGQKFLVERIKDPSWVPVFIDNFTIIFLEKNQANQPIIEKYGISQEAFRIVQ
jgi:hypothetical protein